MILSYISCIPRTLVILWWDFFPCTTRIKHFTRQSIWIYFFESTRQRSSFHNILMTFVGISNLTAGNFLFSFRTFLYPKLSSGSGFSFFGFPHTKWSLQTLQDFFGIHILPFGFCLLIALAHRVRASLFLRSVGKANSWNGGSQSHPSFSRIHLCTLHIEDDHLLSFFPLFGQPTTAQDRCPNPIAKKSTNNFDKQ